MKHESQCGKLADMANKVVLDHRVNVEVNIDAQDVISAYLRDHGIVGLLEMVHAVIVQNAHVGSETAERRCMKAARLLDKVIDEV